ncbi:hypothetical protein TNIN_490741 [Trichonephila inaurata madagascariensis]|uniref:Uncharacterized protein n=1 Tax=Trichonephila inaurata madagascariensis TaxID=2747483 RepID=A0A8X6X397_9ARAC|nr:hypothetical protein TNIN_490741 [Trichonephila inaurata madagascariensis]
MFPPNEIVLSFPVSCNGPKSLSQCDNRVQEFLYKDFIPHSWGSVLLAHRRITERNSQLAGEASESSISNAYQAKNGCRRLGERNSSYMPVSPNST